MKRFHRRIREKAEDPWAPPVLIVAFGDSVTQGMTTFGSQAHGAVYHERFKRLLESEHPLSTFSVINAGVSGQTAPGATALVERDVIRHAPDLTLVGFGLNDAWNGLDGIGMFVEAMNDIVERIRTQTQSDVILLTPNFMNTREPAEGTPDTLSACRASADLQIRGVLGAYAQAIRDLALTHDLPCADVYREWETSAASGMDTDSMLANGMNHPTEDAHAIPAQLLIRIVRAHL